MLVAGDGAKLWGNYAGNQAGWRGKHGRLQGDVTVPTKGQIVHYRCNSAATDSADHMVRECSASNIHR